MTKCGYHPGVFTQSISVPAQQVHSCEQQDGRTAAASPGEGSLQLCFCGRTAVCTEAGARHLQGASRVCEQGTGVMGAEAEESGHTG